MLPAKIGRFIGSSGSESCCLMKSSSKNGSAAAAAPAAAARRLGARAHARKPSPAATELLPEQATNAPTRSRRRPLASCNSPPPRDSSPRAADSMPSVTLLPFLPLRDVPRGKTGNHQDRHHSPGVACGSVVAVLALISAGLAYLWFRPNRAEIDARLGLEHWDVVADGLHNSNTDMILWRGDFLLVHDARPYHFGSPDARLVVRRSRDGRHWEELARLAVPGKDIRDPKLAVIGGKLFLYALPNSGKMATPEGTVVATSDDAVQWTPFEPVEPAGWLFWRPKSNDGGATWYVPAYWHAHGKSILLRSTDGRALAAGLGDPRRRRQRRDRHRVPARRPPARHRATRDHARHDPRQLRRPDRDRRRGAALHRSGRHSAAG